MSIVERLSKAVISFGVPAALARLRTPNVWEPHENVLSYALARMRTWNRSNDISATCQYR
jgi:hypothetical protein